MWSPRQLSVNRHFCWLHIIYGMFYQDISESISIHNFKVAHKSFSSKEGLVRIHSSSCESKRAHKIKAWKSKTNMVTQGPYLVKLCFHQVKKAVYVITFFYFWKHPWKLQLCKIVKKRLWSEIPPTLLLIHFLIEAKSTPQNFLQFSLFFLSFTIEGKCLYWKTWGERGDWQISFLWRIQDQIQHWSQFHLHVLLPNSLCNS